MALEAVLFWASIPHIFRWGGWTRGLQATTWFHWLLIMLPGSLLRWCGHVKSGLPLFSLEYLINSIDMKNPAWSSRSFPARKTPAKPQVNPWKSLGKHQENPR